MKALFKTIIITALTATLLAAPGSTFAQDKKDAPTGAAWRTA